jgi:hypothetical protein
MKKVSDSSKGCCPAHYCIPGSEYEVIDIIRAYAPVFTDCWEYFCFGSALQYSMRAHFKGEESRDLGKALVYLGWWKQSVDGRKID